MMIDSGGSHRFVTNPPSEVSNCPAAKWSDPALTGATPDYVIHNAHEIEPSGESPHKQKGDFLTGGTRTAYE
jgi:hypothetical protein